MALTLPDHVNPGDTGHIADTNLIIDALAALDARQQPRATASKTTASLAAGASEQGTITLAAGYRLLRITSSAPARVRLYTTAAKQAADLARPIGTDPAGDHGCVLEYVATSGLLSADLSPTVDGFDGKAAPDGAIPITVTNTGAGIVAIQVDFLWIRTE